MPTVTSAAHSHLGTDVGIPDVEVVSGSVSITSGAITATVVTGAGSPLPVSGVFSNQRVTTIDNTTGTALLDSLDVWPDWSVTPTWMGVQTTANLSTQLDTGKYYAISNTALYFKQGDVGVVATSSGCHFLAAGERIKLVVANSTAKGYVSAIRSTSDGMLQFFRTTKDV